MSKDELANITLNLLASDDEREELQCAHLLSAFLTQFSLDETDSNNKARKYTDTVVIGGVALSPSEAAVCIDDYLRTVRFIKGAYHAIKELQRRFPEQKINILYAGCGPYATILTPILPLFTAEEIGVTLLDISSYSIQSVQLLLTALGLDNRIDAVICGDATTYTHASSSPLHMAVSETMYHALVREPQVAITHNLVPQITPNGILVPEEIRIDLMQAFFAKERYWNIADNSCDTRTNFFIRYEYEPICLGKIFSIGKDHLFSEAERTSGLFKSGWFQTPSDFQNRPDLCLFTTVTVFKDICLHSSESFITNPFCVTSIYSLKQGSTFQLIYNFGQIPEWKFEAKE
jgi:hypothetical protein